LRFFFEVGRILSDGGLANVIVFAKRRVQRHASAEWGHFRSLIHVNGEDKGSVLNDAIRWTKSPDAVPVMERRDF
jgi:hypothetical protein